MNSLLLGRILEILGILLIVMGFVNRYRVNRRKYYKRFQPMERVSFERKWMSDFGTGFSEFLTVALIVVGIIIWIAGWINNDGVKTRQEAAQHHHTTSNP